ncbi:MAG: murein biosynthesis integral membrane protein MurJ [Parachlamydiales bacterium]|nr:murein biosynthesis integral membrane protein MurJ [Parachlamydiales bacterium]
MTDTTKTIASSFRNFFLGTFLSRITGLLRDVSMAVFFGSSSQIASFMVAYRFANLFRRLFAESSLNASFIPHYEAIRMQDKKEASIFFRDLFFTLFFLLLFIAIFFEGSLIFINKSFFQNDIINLTILMFPGLIFICLYALSSSILQCHKKFFLPSVAPVFFNIVWISTVIAFRKLNASQFVYTLAFFVVLAFFMQYLATFFSSKKIIFENLSIKEFFRFKLFSKDIKKLFKPIFLSIIGIGAVQINSAFDSIFSKIADSSGPAYLWYAIRIYQLPIALFGISLSSAILPPLTRSYKIGDLENFKKFLNVAFKKSFSLMLICTVGIFLIGPSLVNLIFGRGRFDLISFVNTTMCVFAYGSGLVFASFVMIISSSFYAKKQYFIPSLAAILSVILNILLNAVFVFVFDLKSISIAISTSIAAFFNFLILNYFLLKKFKDIYQKDLFFSFVKVFFTVLFAGILTFYIGYYIKDFGILFLLKKSYILPKSFFSQLASFLKMSSIYLLCLISFSYLLKTKDILFLKD